MATIGDVNISPIQGYISALNRGLLRLSGNDRETAAEAIASEDERSSAAELYRELTSMRESLEAIRSPLPLNRITTASTTIEVTEYTAASATSATPLGLEPTYSTMTSYEEVNTTTTSYGTPGAYSGASTASPTIGGTYDGRYGDATMVFNVTKGGLVDSDELEIRVDINGTEVARLRELPFSSDTPYAILDKSSGEDTGLTLSLGSGTLVDLDSFTLDISATQGESANPDNLLDGVEPNDPGFDEGYGATAGILYVNDQWTSIDGDISLNEALDRITETSNGVTASYDQASDRVILTSQTAGSDQTITLGSDSTGLLTALKLDGAVTVPGLDPGESRPLSAALPAINSGQFTINGVAIAVDRDNDTLDDLLERINGSTAGVSALFDQESQRVTIRSIDKQQALQLDSNGTALFTTLGITDGQYDPSSTTTQQTIDATQRYGTPRATARSAVRAYADASSTINDLFNERNGYQGAAATLASSLRESIKGAIRNTFTDIYSRYDEHDVRFRSTLGIDADFSGNRSGPLEFDADQRSQMLRGMLHSGRSMNQLLFGSRSDEEDGMVERMIAVIDQGQRELREKYGEQGLLFDSLA